MIQDLHNKAITLATEYRRAERELIDVLGKIDQMRGYRKIGFRSLYEYATSALKLSESVAYTLITLARKSREIPELKTKIEAQAIPITQARLIAPILNQSNQDEWIAKAETLSKRALEKEIKKTFPEKCVRETSRYVSENRIELKLGVNEGLMEKLKRIQDLVSQSTGQAATLEEALDQMAELFLAKKDPVQKARRATKHVPERVLKGAALRHEINQRDGGQCTFSDSAGKRCEERRWLDVHHIKPRGHGGQDVLENLATLCRAHHQILHKHEVFQYGAEAKL